MVSLKLIESPQQILPSTEDLQDLVAPSAPPYATADRQVTLPRTLRIVRKSKDRGSTNSVCWLDNDMVVNAKEKCLQLRNPNLSIEQFIETDGASIISCVRQCSYNHLLVTVQDNDKLTLWIYANDLTPIYSLMDIPNDGRTSQFGWGSRSKDFAVIDSLAKELKIYNVNQQLLETIHLGDISWPWGCHITADDQHIVVSDHQPDGKLRKYSRGQGQIVWTCGGLVSPTGICQGQSGEFYVGSGTERCIYQLDENTGKSYDRTYVITNVAFM